VLRTAARRRCAWPANRPGGPGRSGALQSQARPSLRSGVVASGAMAPVIAQMSLLAREGNSQTPSNFVTTREDAAPCMPAFCGTMCQSAGRGRWSFHVVSSPQLHLVLPAPITVHRLPNPCYTTKGR